MEWAARASGGQFGVPLASRRERAFGVDRDEGAEPAVEPRDALETGSRGLDGGTLTRPDRFRERGDRELVQPGRYRSLSTTDIAASAIVVSISSS